MSSTVTHPQTKSFFKRLLVFNDQMFPIYPNQILLIFSYGLNYILVCQFLLNRPVDTTEVVLGSLSYLLMVYFLRICDEIKDFPTDQINFPDRPLVTGVIQIFELKRMMGILVILMFSLQVLWLQKTTFIVFLFIQLYLYLMYKWFFIEDRIRPSLSLALYTHNPVAYFFQIYFISFFPFSSNLLFFALAEGLTGTAWEVSRKIRGKTQEDHYVTYTRIWGYRTPVFVVAGLLILSYAFTLHALNFSILEGIQKWVLLLPIIALGAYGFFAVQFIRKPDYLRPLVFRTIVETYKLLIVIAFLFEICWGVAR
jgi:hypothetical protein